MIIIYSEIIQEEKEMESEEYINRKSRKQRADAEVVLIQSSLPYIGLIRE